MKRLFSVIASACAICFAVASCQKDDSANAPKVPSVETIRIDLSTLPVTKSDNSEALASLVSSLNEFWGYIYDQIINIPVKGLEIVAGVQPVQDGNSYTWKVSDTNIAGQTYDVTLTGVVISDKVNWELSVSRDGTGGFQNYTWITGWSMKDGSQGEWYVTVGPGDLDLLVTSSWTAADGEVQSCKLTYNLNHALGTLGSFFSGSYIEYIKGASDNAYTSTLNIHYSLIANITGDIIVEWNTRTKACRFKVSGTNNWVDC